MDDKIITKKNQFTVSLFNLPNKPEASLVRLHDEEGGKREHGSSKEKDQEKDLLEW